MRPMIFRGLMLMAVWATALLVPGIARATFIPYVANPSTNSVQWGAEVASLGSSVNTDVNFNAMATGTLQNNFYSASDGVTLTPSDPSINQVVNGVGPGQGNTNNAIPGEGVHQASNYLQSTSPAASSSLTISFAHSVYGAGLFTLDYFGQFNGSNTLTIEAFSGQNGTGTLIGSATGLGNNFQQNGLYFLGVVSTAGDIGSIVFLRAADSSGDILGIDDIRFAPAVVPEPASLVMLGTGLMGLLGFSLRRKK